MLSTPRPRESSLCGHYLLCSHHVSSSACVRNHHPQTTHWTSIQMRVWMFVCAGVCYSLIVCACVADTHTHFRRVFYWARVQTQSRIRERWRASRPARPMSCIYMRHDKSRPAHFRLPLSAPSYAHGLYCCNHKKTNTFAHLFAYAIVLWRPCNTDIVRWSSTSYHRPSSSSSSPSEWRRVVRGVCRANRVRTIARELAPKIKGKLMLVAALRHSAHHHESGHDGSHYDTPYEGCLCARHLKNTRKDRIHTLMIATWLLLQMSVIKHLLSIECYIPRSCLDIVRTHAYTHIFSHISKHSVPSAHGANVKIPWGPNHTSAIKHIACNVVDDKRLPHWLCTIYHITPPFHPLSPICI